MDDLVAVSGFASVVVDGVVEQEELGRRNESQRRTSAATEYSKSPCYQRSLTQDLIVARAREAEDLCSSRLGRHQKSRIHAYLNRQPDQTGKGTAGDGGRFVCRGGSIQMMPCRGEKRCGEVK